MLSLQRQSELVKKLSNLSRRSYELGVISYSEFLKSQDFAKKAEYDYVKAIVSYMIASSRSKLQWDWIQ
jgi:outer membrane protein TolC